MISKTIYEICSGNICDIENFEKAFNDLTQMWHCHHRLETHDLEGNEITPNLTPKQLKERNLYYHRPPEELIFLTKADHNRIHNERCKSYGFKGHHHTEESRLKNSLAHVGKKQSEEQKQKHSEYMKQYYEDHPELKENMSQRMTELSKDPEFIQKVSQGVRRHYEEHPEARQAMSDRLKGRKYSEKEYAAHQAQYEARRGTHLSEETKKKIGDANRGIIHNEEYKRRMSESCKKVVHTEEWVKKAADANRGKEHDKTNMKWFTNGVINYRGAECPEGFRPGKVNAKKNTSAVGKHWYTDDIHNIRAKECPEGYHRGRTI